MTFRTLLAAGAISAFTACATQAAPIFNTMTQPSSAAYLVAPTVDSGNGPLGQSFTTGAAAVLTNIELGLNASNPTSPGSFVVTLYSDDLDTFDTPLLSLGTFTDTAIAGLSGVLDITGISYALTASTRYWIVLASDPGNTAVPSATEWQQSDTDLGTGVTGQLSYYDNASWQLNDSNPFLMSVNVTSVVNSPEPATLVILGGGLLALGLARRIRCPGAALG